MSQDAGYVISTGSLPWRQLAPGIDIRLVRTSPETGHWTILQRSRPGSRLPRHRHLAPSEFYIIKGHGVHPQTGPYGEGDYVYEHTGAIHDEFEFENEIILFMTSYGPTAFLNPDNSVKGFMDVEWLENLYRGVNRRGGE